MSWRRAGCDDPTDAVRPRERAVRRRQGLRTALLWFAGVLLLSAEFWLFLTMLDVADPLSDHRRVVPASSQLVPHDDPAAVVAVAPLRMAPGASGGGVKRSAPLGSVR